MARKTQSQGVPLLDLHAHFPMHSKFPPRLTAGAPPIGKELEFWAANMLLNFQGGTPRMSLAEFLAGAGGGVASVLYDPEDEFFRDATPVPEAFGHLLAQMENVETEVAGSVTVVRNPAQLRRCLRGTGEKFLFHAVEGAFSLGGDAGNVDVLARRGVAYVIVAHLFFRGVATCENALPFVPDSVFQSVLNPQQDPAVGLTDLGRRIVRGLMDHGILVDITHCTQRAQAEIFQLARDHGNAPVISSHTGVRGTSDYPLNLTREAVRQIAASKGVVGLILATHWLRQPREQIFGPDGYQLLFNAIDCVHDWTGSYDHIAVGSDLDGFIQPIKPCGNYAETPALVEAIRAKYPGAAERILYANALEVLERGWKGAAP
ncbi:MAG TPA: membrane dipeptidase [Opitutaceae bacterium]|nr:membrane dipeptidase [Opitutaceae bacterium]